MITNNNIDTLMKDLINNLQINNNNEELIILFSHLLSYYDTNKIIEYLKFCPMKFKFLVIIKLRYCNKINNYEMSNFILNYLEDNEFNNLLKNLFNLNKFSNNEYLINVIEKLIQYDINYITPCYINYFYFLCFNNNNNKLLKIALSKFHRMLFPKINIDYKLNFNNKKKRIGFISTNFKLHSVGRDRSGIIVNLDRNLFDIVIFYFNKYDNDVYFNLLWNSNSKNIILGNEFDEWCKNIFNENLDVLVYCDIGIQEETYLLSHYRLSKKQITTWGHSETSGINTIDYFISSELYEIEKAKEHYSENLILHKSLCTYYYDKFYDLIHINKKEEFCELKNNFTITYLQYLHKISNEDLILIVNILREIDNIKIVFINGSNYKKDKEDLIFKLNNYKEKIIIYDHLRTSDFYELIKKSDLILDSYPHGGCNTSLEAFYYNKIIITKPSQFLRGRFTYGFYKKMDILEFICNTNYEIILKIKQIKNNENYKNKFENLIIKSKNLLFNDIESINEWNKTLLSI